MYRRRKTLIKICCLQRICKKKTKTKLHQLHNIQYKSVFKQRALLLRLVNARPSCLRLDSGRDGEPSPECFVTVDILPPRATRVAVSLTKSPHTAHKHKQQRSLHTTTLMFKTLLFTHAANGQDFQDKHTT